MSKVLRSVQLFEKLFDKIETFLLSFTLIVMLGFAFLQVLLRTLSNLQVWLNDSFAFKLAFSFQPIAWGDVFNRSLVLWVGFFGAVLAVRQHQHLSLEVLTKFLPKKIKPYSDLLVNLVVIVVTALLTKVSWAFFQDQITYESHELLFEGFPQAYITIIFPLGFALLSFHYLFRIIENLFTICGVSTKNEEAEEEISVRMKMDA